MGSLVPEEEEGERSRISEATVATSPAAASGREFRALCIYGLQGHV